MGRGIYRMSNAMIHRALFFMADYMRADKSLKKLRFLKKSQYWDECVLKIWQLEKINILLIHAKAHSPFYKKRLSKIKLPINDIKSLQDIPILTKKDIRENIEDIKCRNIDRKRFVLSNTGGSTGEPMRYYCDRISLGWKRAAVLRSMEWAGLKLGEKNVQMTGSHYEYTKRRKAVNRFKLWLLNGKDLSVAYVNDSMLEDYYKKIIEWQPASIWGYASAVYQLAEFIKKNHAGADFGFIEAIITSSETLQSGQRETINGVFGDRKVYDHYGASEFYAAAECRCQKGYHVNEDVLKLEIVDNEGVQAGPDETGRVILTDLYNCAFPFIRYEIGDVGILSKEDTCECGVRLPRLKRLEGRVADMIVLKDRVLTPPNFTNIFRPLKGIEQYQIVQKKMECIQVNIIRNHMFNE
ncbi:MAG: hypothetical protein Q8R48_03510, partial [Candidatus Omnitrophota bacterium]|nr:hypothetical protein [Candidatus Omnitrophota bacterium]